ncbi:unnamed protein product [Brachionus calyciflorus]|uniref:Uncharacterized protein n=1 Tax=Brachionus calyciflorus TaxID=104777 RepID=A0A813MBB6_9BILA|nr:unnamed protein product [Brachionus calyciflorus]
MSTRQLGQFLLILGIVATIYLIVVLFVLPLYSESLQEIFPSFYLLSYSAIIPILLLIYDLRQDKIFKQKQTKMIRTFLKPIIYVNKYQSITKKLFQANSNIKLSFVKSYSELSAKNEIIPEVLEKSDLIPESKIKHELNTSLVIDIEFIKTLDQKLDSRNFKTLAYKQDEINNIVYKMENPYNLFYLYEKYSKEFNSYNLVNFIKKMAYLSRNDKLLGDYGVFVLPEKVKKLMTKQIIKISPQFEPFQCFTVLQKLNQLGFKLNDFSAKAILQITKYHVNELSLDEVILTKEILSKLKNENGTLVTNEYSDNLDKALDLAVQTKLDNLKHPRQAIHLLKNFSKSISIFNFEQIIDLIYERVRQSNLNEIVDLVKILAERNFSHLKLELKIKKFIIKENLDDSLKLKHLHDCFLKLKFYDQELQDYFIQKQLNNLTKSDSFDVLSGLLQSCIFFGHKSLDLLEFSNCDKYLQNELFPVADFIYYSALTGYDKLTDNEWSNLVRTFISQNHTDQTKMKILKALCWVKQNNLAKELLNTIELPQNLEINDKLFLKEVFASSFFKFDEKLPSKSRVEEAIENCIKNIQDKQYEVKSYNTSLDNASYFKNFEIVDLNLNKKCLVQMSGVSNKFRNINEYTNNYKFRKEHLVNIVAKENESLPCIYWIAEAKMYQNMSQQDLLESIKNKLSSLFEKK